MTDIEIVMLATCKLYLHYYNYYCDYSCYIKFAKRIHLSSPGLFITITVIINYYHHQNITQNACNKLELLTVGDECARQQREKQT